MPNDEGCAGPGANRRPASNSRWEPRAGIPLARNASGRAAKLAAPILAMLLMTVGGAWAIDESRYPDLKGEWRRAERGDLAGGAGALRYDPSKPPTLGQGAPLTPEYQAIYEANLADQAAGGQGIETTFACLAPGMPRIMLAYAPMEIVVTADTTYILIMNPPTFET